MEFIGPSLYIKEIETLVLGDLHIGSDERLSQSGSFVPLFDLTEVKETINHILTQVHPKLIILLGDLANHFGPPTYSETKGIRELLYTLQEKAEVIIIEGNHDRFLKPLFERMNIPLKKELIIKEYFFTHGDILKAISKNTKSIIIGHEHPAITFQNGVRSETYKCIIKTTYKEKELLVLPSINILTIGSPINKGKTLSPYLKELNPKKTDIYAVDTLKVLHMGTLDQFM